MTITAGRIMCGSYSPHDITSSSPFDLPGYAPAPSTRRADASRTVALLHAHATRGQVTTSTNPPRRRGGPEVQAVSDAAVIRSAAQLLRGHRKWACER